MRKTFSWLVILALLLSMMPAVFAAENELVIGNNEMELPRAAEEASVYTFVAPETGTLYISAVAFYYEASWSNGYQDNSSYMEEWNSYTVFTVNGEQLNGGYYGSVEVVAGETYTFSWSHNESSRYGFKATVNLSWTNELIPVPGIDMPMRPAHLPSNTVEIGAGEQVLYNITYEFEGYVLTVTGENAYIYYEYTDMWTDEIVQGRIDAVGGVVEYDLALYGTTMFYIGNDGDEAAAFELDYYAPLGGMHNPQIVSDLEDIELTIPASHEGYFYYKWYATEIGTVWVTPGDFYVRFENCTTGEDGEYDDTRENYFIYVTPGDELLILIGGWVEKETFFSFEEVDYHFVPGYRAGSVQNPFEVDLMTELDLDLYKETVYYSWTPAQDMVVVLNFTYLYSYNSNLPTMIINGEEFEFGVTSFDGNEISVSAELTVTAGEPVIMELSTVNSVHGSLVAIDVTPAFEILLGDVNGDSNVNYLDAMLIAQYYVGDITEADLNMAASDVNGDDDINYLDAMLIAQYYVGDIDSFIP